MNGGTNDANRWLVFHPIPHRGGYHVRICETIQKKVRAEGRAEVYEVLRQAIKEGRTLEEVVKKHDAGNGNKANPSASSVPSSPENP
ncbi:hypothetical protein C6500_10875 [Candidatus Poribacteria bacterium]|nr:MAG: hypothetical protein C6500_10875 [Candidatus Poribacteria bacterium]